jgi:transposase
MRAYSMDLRDRVVAAVDGGMTQEQAVTFRVSINTVGRYLARRRNIGSLAPTAQRHGPVPEKTQLLQAWLPDRLGAAADATLAEHVSAFASQRGVVVSAATMSRAIAALPGDDSDQALTPRGRRRPGRPLKSKA